MKVKRLGIEWGAAFEDAEPIEVSYQGAQFQSFISEGHDLVVELPPEAIIVWTAKGFRVTIPT